MPFNGSGTFSRVYTWATEALSPPIAISKLDTQEADIASALSSCMLRDGTGLPTAAQDFNAQDVSNIDALSCVSLTVSGALTLNGALTTDNTTADEAGFKGLPQNPQTGNYTLVLADAGKEIYHASGAGAGDTYTIPANASVAFPVGTVIVITNDASDTLAIAITSDTLVLTGTTSTGSRTLGQNGQATISKKTSTRWHISGAGLS
jgi:hypothetical protein